MIHNIARRSAFASEDVFSFRHSPVSAIVVAKDAPFNQADFLSIALRGGKVTRGDILVNRISLLDLAHVSDVRFGLSHGLTEVLVTPVTGELDLFVAVVELGYLDLPATDSELDITLVSSVAAEFSVCAVDPLEQDDHVMKWLRYVALSDAQQDVVELWAVRATASALPFTLDLSAVVTAGDASSICNLVDACAVTAAFGQVEAQAPTKAVCLYKAKDGLPGPVEWNLTGTDAANWSLVVATMHASEERNIPARRARGARRVRRIQAMKRDTVAGLGVSAGIVGSR